MGSYKKFALMMTVSFLVMYGVMFLNVASFSHVYSSVTRFYMTLLMVAPMMISMLLFMWRMYPNKAINIGILISAFFIFLLSLIGLRTQTFVDDEQWIKAMIPHHSSAILTSSNADFMDPETRMLAEEIIKVQEEEIALMKQMLKRLKQK